MVRLAQDRPPTLPIMNPTDGARYIVQLDSSDWSGGGHKRVLIPLPEGLGKGASNRICLSCTAMVGNA